MNLALWFALHVIFGQVRSVGFETEIPVLSSNRLTCGPSLRCFHDCLLKLKIGMLPTLAAWQSRRAFSSQRVAKTRCVPVAIRIIGAI